MKLRSLLPLLALAGCAVLQQPAVDGVIGETLSAARAPLAGQKAALASAQEAFSTDTGDLNRLRLAMLLVVLPAPLHDDARAAELLEPIANPAEPGMGRLAALLAAQVTERRRLAREVDRLTRERLAADKEHAATDKERAATDKERDKREEALRQQLEALRAIERGILEREERRRKQQR
jgi:hypothetical protein